MLEFFAGMQDAELRAALLQTREVRPAFKIMPVNTDRTCAGAVPAGALQVVSMRPGECRRPGRRAVPDAPGRLVLFLDVRRPQDVRYFGPPI
jgi:hypothetical protein